jgi:hypothetical protein
LPPEAIKSPVACLSEQEEGMDATDRFKRLVIVILVCFRHRSHDRFLQRKKAEASAIEVERRLKNSAFWVLYLRRRS